MQTPAINAASLICVLASISFPSSYATGRYFIIFLTASDAYASVSTPAFFEVYASTAWVSASSPVCAVIFCGDEIEYSGSTTATFGSILSSAISSFISFSESVMTVNLVASEPVPAVVGTATIGTKPVFADTAFAESIGLPPPTPMIRLHFPSIKASVACDIITSVGSPVIPSNTALEIPAFASPDKTSDIACDAATCFPVTISAFVPSFFISGSASSNASFPI